MKILENDIKWLKSSFPNLRYDVEAQKIEGELDFCAAFNKRSGKMQFGSDPTARTLYTYLCDVFEIEILLGPGSIQENGWPKVYEVGGDHTRIAGKNNMKPIDLHFYEDGVCCLGIRYAREKNLTIEQFLYQRVIPFFYRLSYTDQYGIKAARTDLWGEYSHEDQGPAEHVEEMFRFAQSGLGKDSPCPCESGVKFKRCCWDEVNEVMKRLSPPIRCNIRREGIVRP